MPVLHDWLLTPERVAVHLPTRTAVVADLHLGYAEARRRGGDAVPEESVSALLEPLHRVQQRDAARRLVIAGDLLEDGDCRDSLKAFREWLDRSEMDLIAVVPGNHDADLETCCATRRLTLPVRREGVMVGDWRIVHGEGVLPDGPVVHGHDHPCLRWSPKSRALRPRFSPSRVAYAAIDGPCYLTGSQRLILPAFSKEAAGANVLSVRRWRDMRCQVIAGERVLDLGEVATLRRRLSVAASI
ncbi:MAG: metallophosphoesterase [Gemmataceae bacterium]